MLSIKNKLRLIKLFLKLIQPLKALEIFVILGVAFVPLFY